MQRHGGLQSQQMPARPPSAMIFHPAGGKDNRPLRLTFTSEVAAGPYTKTTGNGVHNNQVPNSIL